MMKHRTKNGRVVACAALLALASGTAGADAVFRCTGDSGVPVFTDQRCGPEAVRIPVPEPTGRRAPPADVNNDAGIRIDVDNSNVVNVTPAPAAPPARSQPRGIPFSVYRLLDRGMSEGEVLAVAGPPERETVDSLNTTDGFRRKSYYYFNRGYNDTVTRIQFENGRVVSLERKRLVGP